MSLSQKIFTIAKRAKDVWFRGMREVYPVPHQEGDLNHAFYHLAIIGLTSLLSWCLFSVIASHPRLYIACVIGYMGFFVPMLFGWQDKDGSE